MKVELSIADDRELRNVIRDTIKGEVKSIARGEIKSIIAEVTKEGVVPVDKAEVERIVGNEIRAIVREALSSASFGNPTYIQKVAREEIGKLIYATFADGKAI